MYNTRKTITNLEESKMRKMINRMISEKCRNSLTTYWLLLAVFNKKMMPKKSRMEN